MKRQQIYEAFDEFRPDPAAKERMLENILRASDSQPAGKDVPMKNYNRRRPMLVAAMVAVALLLVGCTAVALMNLKSLTISEETYVKNAYYKEDGSKVPAAEKEKNVISLQGIEGSKNQLAAKEWYEFEQFYDPDNTLLYEADKNKYLAPEEYSAYFVYTQEMIDKVDEICAKYDLQLAGPYIIAQYYQSEALFEALGLNGVTKEAAAEIEYNSGSFYACGNFEVGFEATLTGKDAQWPYAVSGSYHYKDKAYFDTSSFSLWDMENVEQWNYTTSDGVQLLIINTGERAWAFCDRDDAFLYVNFLSIYEHSNGTQEAMTARDIEQTVELMDFTLKPQKPDMEQAQKRIDETEAAYQAEQAAKLEALQSQPWEDPFVHDSFEELIAYIPEHEDEFCLLMHDGYLDFENSCAYALQDVTGDGQEELLIGRDGSVISIWKMVNGKTSGLACGEQMYVCENGIYEMYIFRDGEPRHYYMKIALDPDDMNEVAYVAYSTYEGSWMYMDYAVDKEAYPISEEEAEKIIGSFVRMEIDWKPISEFPLT